MRTDKSIRGRGPYEPVRFCIKSADLAINGKVIERGFVLKRECPTG